MAPSRMTTRSTRPNAEGSFPEARSSLEQKLDQIFATLTEANRNAQMAHEVVLDLKDEVAKVCRDNACLEGLLASETSSGRREDFDEEVQTTKPDQKKMAVGRRHQKNPEGTLPDWKQKMIMELSKGLGAHHSQTLVDLV
ncbi:hypothetical protein PanWU01x14_259650 [Parasponia andersonii]|uniref:Uncharacterized protein n=1 Tax=Parasponia andersonii TaxID=3476 RepID=A0A2P5B9A4_PARAD|nr:hypothetical protein PanWU01x14_259650 [Parasponia andersonii]